MTYRLAVSAEMVFVDDPAEDILALDDALTRLTSITPLAVRIVEMRCFAGLTIDQTARLLGVSESSVERQWRYARAWLHRELSGSETGPEKDDGHDS